MSNLSKYLSQFLNDYLPNERSASINTCESYAYTFQLLVNYAAKRHQLLPSKLDIHHLTANFIVDHLNYLENDRHNSTRTRNARCSAIKSFFRFLEYRNCKYIEQSRRIQCIPRKKFDERLIPYLTLQEMHVILNSPSQNNLTGIRDRAMISLCFSAGLRVSELVGIFVDQVNFSHPATINVIGKGRKERILPLQKEVVIAIKAWIAVRPNHVLTPELFLNLKNQAITRSGFEYILSKHVAIATKKFPSLSQKHISPHTLRHTCAMHTLKSTHDIRKVALWLGHESIQSTEIYLRADPSEKLSMLMDVVPPSLKSGKFKAPDKLMNLLRER